MRLKSELMDEAAINRALIRISHEILEKNKGLNNVVLVGIHRRGVLLSRRIVEIIESVEKQKVQLGELDITLYRDDLSLLSEHPVINGTNIPFNITDKNIVLIDDVIYTARTARAAMEAVCQMGRPKSIQLAVLIDRGHRELPIKADFVGKNIPTSRDEMVCVNLIELDKKTNVELYDRAL